MASSTITTTTGTPSNARFIPVRAIFSPILLLQVVTAIISVWRFFERLVVKLQDGITSERYISISSKIDELFMLVQHGSRLIAWSIDEHSKEEEAHLCYTNNIGFVSILINRRILNSNTTVRYLSLK
nr:uncharacterized protein LOC127344568 isoform X3 [Lolium perenne]